MLWCLPVLAVHLICNLAIHIDVGLLHLLEALVGSQLPAGQGEGPTPATSLEPAIVVNHGKTARFRLKTIDFTAHRPPDHGRRW